MSTKREIFNALRTFTFTDVTIGETIVTAEQINDFLDKSIAQIDNRLEKEKERRAAKKAENDEVLDQVKAVLTSTPQKVNEIVAAIDNPEITPARVVVRLATLVRAGEVVKDEVKVDKRTLKVYSLAD